MGYALPRGLFERTKQLAHPECDSVTASWDAVLIGALVPGIAATNGVKRRARHWSNVLHSGKHATRRHNAAPAFHVGAPAACPAYMRRQHCCAGPRCRPTLATRGTLVNLKQGAGRPNPSLASAAAPTLCAALPPVTARRRSAWRRSISSRCTARTSNLHTTTTYHHHRAG